LAQGCVFVPTVRYSCAMGCGASAVLGAGHGPHDVFCSHQHTALAYAQMKVFVGSNPRSLKASLPPFNKKHAQVPYPNLVELDVPCFGIDIVNATMDLFASKDIRDLSMKLGVAIPTRSLDTFVKTKLHKVRELVNAARARDDSDRNSEAIERLDGFVSAFEALTPSDVTSWEQWDCFVAKHVVRQDWHAHLHFEHVLSNFGFEPETAAELGKQQYQDEDKLVTLEQYSLRWLSKALSAYRVPATLSDVVNLVFAMLQSEASTEASIANHIRDFAQRVENREWKCMWIPDCLVFDGEVDDTLTWLLLKYVHTCRGEPRKPYVLAQLPKDIGKEPLRKVMRLLKKHNVRVFVDPESRNGKSVKENFKVGL